MADQDSDSKKKLARREENTLDKEEYIEARIVWPALGFPEVVAPQCSFQLLILSKKSDLSKQDVARHLRYAAWPERRTRYFDSYGVRFNPAVKGGFSIDEITIKPATVHRQDDLVQVLDFANLALWFREFYKDNGLPHLFQVTIQTEADHLPVGQYNLFWVNRGLTSDVQHTISEELKFLKDRFVQKRAPDGEWYIGSIVHPPEGEYMSEYGVPPWKEPFVEVLHPLFVQEARRELKIAQLADSHVCTRYDVFQEVIDKALKEDPKNGIGYGYVKGQYNNYNRQTEFGIEQACKVCDVLVFLGDLIDYGRGHSGKPETVREDWAFQLDRNWFLFYKLLASQDNYKKPIYTVLGNHDWRLHPYGPISKMYSIASDLNLRESQVKAVHGPNAEAIWYSRIDQEPLIPYLARMPLVTALDSIKWYLLLVNPFLDYVGRIPGGFALLMIDWAKEEEVLDIGFNPVGLPIAKDSITDTQKQLIEYFLSLDECKAKIVGLHATIIGPNPDMDDKLMGESLIRCPTCKGEGKRSDGTACVCLNLSQTKVGDGSWRPTHKGYVTLFAGHPDDANEPNYLSMIPILGPLFRTDDVVEYTFFLPVHGTIKRHRNWLIREFGKKRVALVMSGHCHRNGAFQLEEAGVTSTPKVRLKLGNTSDNVFHGPLYHNVTSIGPVGYERNSKISHPIPPGFAEIAVDTNGTIPRKWEYHYANIPLFEWNWGCWIRKVSKACWVKLHNNGIVAGFDRKEDAEVEKGTDSVWPSQSGYADWECWLRKSSKANKVFLHGGGIVGVYRFKNDADIEKEKDEVWDEMGSLIANK